MVAALERLYQSAALRREIGAAGVAFMQGRTWPAHAEATRRCIFRFKLFVERSYEPGATGFSVTESPKNRSRSAG